MPAQAQQPWLLLAAAAPLQWLWDGHARAVRPAPRARGGNAPPIVRQLPKLQNGARSGRAVRHAMRSPRQSRAAKFVSSLQFVPD